jgi:CRISPR system Cascade subunit CasA
VTGDPWAPIEVKAAKCFSVTGAGFNYRVGTRLLGSEYQKPLLAEVQDNDSDEGLALLAISVARGGGKTAGYHERSIPISKTVKRLLFAGVADQIAAAGHARVELVGALAYRVLRPALHCLLRDGKEAERLTPKQSANLDRQAERWLKRLDHEIDATFFSDLWREFETEDEGKRDRIRDAWLQDLIARAALILHDACRAVPLASIHRYRARTRAQGWFSFLARKRFPQLYPETTDAAADVA